MVFFLFCFVLLESVLKLIMFTSLLFVPLLSSHISEHTLLKITFLLSCSFKLPNEFLVISVFDTILTFNLGFFGLLVNQNPSKQARHEIL